MTTKDTPDYEQQREYIAYLLKDLETDMSEMLARGLKRIYLEAVKHEIDLGLLAQECKKFKFGPRESINFDSLDITKADRFQTKDKRH